MTARAANVPCISVTWGFRDRDELERAGAEAFALEPGSAACVFFQILTASAQTAAAGGAEGDHGDAVKIVGLHKGVQDPGLFPPPDRETDIDGGVAGQRDGFTADFRAHVRIVLLPGGAAAAVMPVEIVGGVRLGSLDLIEICIRKGGKLFRHSLGGAGGREVDHQRVLFGSRGLRHSFFRSGRLRRRLGVSGQGGFGGVPGFRFRAPGGNRLRLIWCGRGIGGRVFGSAGGQTQQKYQRQKHQTSQKQMFFHFNILLNFC